MGLYDRDYTQADFRSSFYNVPQMRMNFPKITPAVKWLLIINVSVYLLQILGADRFLVGWFSVYPASLSAALQLWRIITYQFLHGGPGHIIFNMLGLFFLGPTLERHWGSKKFLIFYLACGAAGGLSYILLVTVHFLSAIPMIGASGSILGMLVACAILFPHFIVFIFFFPVPIRVAAMALTALYIVAVITRSENAGGDAAHLAGMAAGAIYVFSQSWRNKFKLQVQRRLWEKKMAARQNLQAEVDRILKKVHTSGIHSLTAKEKRILKQATKAEQKRDEL
jgi:membrane associated rhomboid family serine protease